MREGSKKGIRKGRSCRKLVWKINVELGEGILRAKKEQERLRAKNRARIGRGERVSFLRFRVLGNF